MRTLIDDNLLNIDPNLFNQIITTAKELIIREPKNNIFMPPQPVEVVVNLQNIPLEENTTVSLPFQPTTHIHKFNLTNPEVEEEKETETQLSSNVKHLSYPFKVYYQALHSTLINLSSMKDNLIQAAYLANKVNIHSEEPMIYATEREGMLVYQYHLHTEPEEDTKAAPFTAKILQQLHLLTEQHSLNGVMNWALEAICHELLGFS